MGLFQWSNLRSIVSAMPIRLTYRFGRLRRKSHIVEIRADPTVAHGWWHGLRMSGTNIPGVLTAGAFYRDGKRVFRLLNAGSHYASSSEFLSSIDTYIAIRYCTVVANESCCLLRWNINEFPRLPCTNPRLLTLEVLWEKVQLF